MQKYYKVMSWSQLVTMMVIVTVLYALDYQFLSQYTKQIPESVIKALKFAAFALASYSLLNQIGRDEHRQNMIALVTSNTASADEKKFGREQLVLLATDEKRGTILATVAFVILTLLALIGEV